MTDLATATIGQLLIPVTDLPRAVTFYRDVLGLRFLFTAPPKMSFFMVGDVRILVGVPEDETATVRSAPVYFRVDDIHAACDVLASRGVDFVGPPAVVHRTPTSELWLAEFQDPDGNPLLLMSEPRTGGGDVEGAP